MKAIIEKQRQDHQNTYILYADAEKHIDKFIDLKTNNDQTLN